jgi:hypothetical protein
VYECECMSVGVSVRVRVSVSVSVRECVSGVCIWSVKGRVKGREGKEGWEKCEGREGMGEGMGWDGVGWEDVKGYARMWEDVGGCGRMIRNGGIGRDLRMCELGAGREGNGGLWFADCERCMVHGGLRIVDRERCNVSCGCGW